eukprot:SAG11_NODE_7982_length_1074_cov_1.151795_1_plen_78_part_10
MLQLVIHDLTDRRLVAERNFVHRTAAVRMLRPLRETWKIINKYLVNYYGRSCQWIGKERLLWSVVDWKGDSERRKDF